MIKKRPNYPSAELLVESCYQDSPIERRSYMALKIEELMRKITLPKSILIIILSFLTSLEKKRMPLYHFFTNVMAKNLRLMKKKLNIKCLRFWIQQN
jgi:hypothetical protein